MSPNSELHPEKIPDPDGDKARSINELRCALFFEARRDRHSGGYTDVTPTVRDLLRQIKAKVAKQS